MHNGMAYRFCGRLSFALFSSAFLGGCASGGNESIADASVETVSEQLVKGKTTQGVSAKCMAIP
jgi:hypothetical protein